MFEVNLGANNYFIKFAYPHKHRKVKNRRTTICKIFRIEDDGKYNLVATGIATRNSFDKFNPHLGRKFALKNALEGLNNFENDGEITEYGGIDRRYREHFWKAFFEVERAKYKTDGYNILD